jgi:anti-sigma factor RsiW
MSQNQEIIEAKLCAYIDDELDAAGRAELEKHLAANPQHQRLIEELRRTSALIHNLPHESAPPELAEAFNAHLERSVLLEGVSDDVAAADLKAPRWPQLVAMAAITLLTIGLGIVVYFALPGTGVRPQFVQSSQRQSAPAVNGSDDEQSSDAKTRDLEKSVSQQPQRPAVAKDADAAVTFANSAAEAAVGGVSNGATAGPADHLLTPSAAAQPSEQSVAGATGASTSSPVTLVMHADDPAEARKALVVYLVQQNIAWEPSQSIPAGELAGRRDSDSIVQPTGAAASAGQAELSDQSATSQPALDAKTEAAKAQPTTGLSVPSANVARDLAANKLSLAVSAATQPVPEAMKQLERAREEKIPASRVAATTKPEFAVNCKMTAEQANELRTSLAQPGTLIDPLPADFEAKSPAEAADQQSATTQPANISDSSLGVTSPGAVPTTRPAAAIAAAPPAAAGEADRAASFGVVTTQPAVSPSETQAAPGATQPANSTERLLDLVIVVRPTDRSTTQPTVVAAPEPPTTAPASPVVPATQP